MPLYRRRFADGSLHRASGYSYSMPSKRALARRVTVLLATAIATVIAAACLFIRKDLQTVRAAVRSSAARDVPRSVVNAFTAAEDPCHWKHGRTHTLATVASMFFSNHDQIGSELAGHASLANQLVRRHVNGRGLSRQVAEVLITAVVEATENPATVARAYANSVYLGTVRGKHIYGVTDAASSYYGKRPAQLDLAECVVLAASVKSPRIFSPEVHSDGAVVRRLSVLSRLRELGLVSPQDFAGADRKLRGTAG